MTERDTHHRAEYADRNLPFYWSGADPQEITVTDDLDQDDEVVRRPNPTPTQKSAIRLFVNIHSLSRGILRAVIQNVAHCEFFRVRLSQPFEAGTFAEFSQALAIKELAIEDVDGCLRSEDLVDIANLPNLRLFSLQRQKPVGQLLEPLLRANRLESLYLDKAAGAGTLIGQIAAMTTLQKLSVTLTSDAAAATLSVIGQMSQLRSLSLSFSEEQRLDGTPCEAGAGRPPLRLDPLCGLLGLQELTLSHFQLSESDVMALSQLRQLSAVSLLFCKHTFSNELDAYARFLELREFRIYFVPFSDWENLQHFSKLDTFAWYGVVVPPKMMATLRQIKHLKKVEILGTGLTRREKKQFRRDLEGVDVQILVSASASIFWYIGGAIFGCFFGIVGLLLFEPRADLEAYVSMATFFIMVFSFLIGWVADKCERWLDEREEKKLGA